MPATPLPSPTPAARNDGRSSNLLALDGTIQTYYGAATYQTPVCIYVPEPYPAYPPIVYLRPTPDMFVVPGHRSADSNGLVYLPYLSEWRPESSNVVDLIVVMTSVFSEQPPLRARPPPEAAPRAGGVPMPPPFGGAASPGPYPASTTSPAYGAAAGAAVGPAGGPAPGFSGGPGAGFGGMSADPGAGRFSGSGGGLGGASASAAASTGSSSTGTTGGAAGGVGGKRPTARDPRAERMREVTMLLQSRLQDMLRSSGQQLDQSTLAGEQLEKRGAKAASLLAETTAQATQLVAYGEELERRAAAAKAWLDASDAVTFSHVRAATNAAGAGGGSHGFRASGSFAAAGGAGARMATDDAAAAEGASRASEASPGGAAAGAGGAAGRPSLGVGGGSEDPLSPPSGSASASSASPGMGAGAAAALPSAVVFEDVAAPASRLQGQLLDAVAEDAALEDLFFQMDELLNSGALEARAMLAEVRELGRRQFRARYLARKLEGALLADRRARAPPGMHAQLQHQPSSAGLGLSSGPGSSAATGVAGPSPAGGAGLHDARAAAAQGGVYYPSVSAAATVGARTSTGR